MIFYATVHKPTGRVRNCNDFYMVWRNRTGAEREANRWPGLVGVTEVDISPAQLDLAAIDDHLAARDWKED